MISNIGVYFAIAEGALAEAERLDALARRPKPDGEPGFIVTYDPEQKSFKNSLIAIAFAGMYLESLFYLTGAKRFGIKKYKNEYDNYTYEKKLQLFGLVDQTLLEEAKSFRKMRRELVHEKAVEFTDLTADTIRIAQDDAKKALSFVKRVARELGQGDVAPAS